MPPVPIPAAPPTRAERADRLRPYFGAQLALARRYAGLTGQAWSAAALVVTNLHARFGLGRPAPAHADWRPFAQALDAAGTLEAATDAACAAFAASKENPPDPRSFGCFSYEPPDETGLVRIHFHNRDSDEHSGPLAAAKQQSRRAELAAMTAHIAAGVPSARAIGGGSWLYHLEAYRRLFPPAFAASRQVPPAVRLNGTSTWGQLLDHREAIRPAVLEALTANLPALDPTAPWLVFPLRALRTEAPLQAFCDFYGA